jgi:hypothetical protein
MKDIIMILVDLYNTLVYYALFSTYIFLLFQM